SRSLSPAPSTALTYALSLHDALPIYRTRAFAKRFAPQYKGNMPTMIHAGVYSAVLHYLKAAEAAKTDDGPKVIAKMKEMPTEDRSEEHTSELQSRSDLVCRLLLEKKK